MEFTITVAVFKLELANIIITVISKLFEDVDVLFTLVTLSYSMIILYSRDHKEVGVAHKIISPKNQPQFSQMTMRQYRLGKTKPKQAIKLTRSTFNKFLWNLKKNY